MAEEMWRDLSDKEKGFFGGSKSIFQAAKAAAKAGGGDINRSRSIPVSYTHLTLPTICSV